MGLCQWVANVLSQLHNLSKLAQKCQIRPKNIELSPFETTRGYLMSLFSFNHFHWGLWTLGMYPEVSRLLTDQNTSQNWFQDGVGTFASRPSMSKIVTIIVPKMGRDAQWQSRGAIWALTRREAMAGKKTPASEPATHVGKLERRPPSSRKLNLLFKKPMSVNICSVSAVVQGRKFYFI